jgi:hypothetical protein
MQPTNCEACGGDIEFRREDSVQGLYCKICDSAVVTTYIPRIDIDETIYRVRVLDADFHNEDHVRIVSAISGLKFLAARRLLQQEKPLMLEGKAPNVLQARDKLVNAGLRTEISPEFNY